MSRGVSGKMVDGGSHVAVRGLGDDHRGWGGRDVFEDPLGHTPQAASQDPNPSRVLLAPNTATGASSGALEVRPGVTSNGSQPQTDDVPSHLRVYVGHPTDSRMGPLRPTVNPADVNSIESLQRPYPTHVRSLRRVPERHGSYRGAPLVNRRVPSLPDSRDARTPHTVPGAVRDDSRTEYSRTVDGSGP